MVRTCQQFAWYDGVAMHVEQYEQSPRLSAHGANVKWQRVDVTQIAGRTSVSPRNRSRRLHTEFRLTQVGLSVGATKPSRSSALRGLTVARCTDPLSRATNNTTSHEDRKKETVKYICTAKHSAIATSTARLKTAANWSKCHGQSPGQSNISNSRKSDRICKYRDGRSQYQ